MKSVKKARQDFKIQMKISMKEDAKKFRGDGQKYTNKNYKQVVDSKTQDLEDVEIILVRKQRKL